MTQWNYKINGERLREATQKDDEWETLVELDKVLKSFAPKIKDEYMAQDFEELIEIVDSEVLEGKDAIEQFLEEEDAQEDLQELVNDRLSEFYDLCDGWRVWITL